VGSDRFSAERAAILFTSGLAVTPWATTLSRTVQPAATMIVSLLERRFPRALIGVTLEHELGRPPNVGLEYQLGRLMKSPPGPPMTLGNAAVARVRLIVWCKARGHQVDPDPAEMAAPYGDETSVLDWRERPVCSQCDGQQVDIWCSPEPSGDGIDVAHTRRDHHWRHCDVWGEGKPLAVPSPGVYSLRDRSGRLRTREDQRWGR